MKIIPLEKQFNQIVELIHSSRRNALKQVNSELITLYWKIGEYMSKKVESAEWGEGVIDRLAAHIKTKEPELKGFSDKNLWRMKQFYETYRGNEKLSALLRELNWTNNVLILAKAKTIEEKEFYIRLCIKEKYSSRELERQIDSGFYERVMLSNKDLPVKKAQTSNMAVMFRDTYILDFLDLPKRYSEKDLRHALVSNFRDFVLEFGRDFSLVGEEYRIQVGNNDYFIDLLFYHRELCCLVAFELKIDDFKPEYLGKLNFYLEALDRDVKKKHENPCVGVILCKSKNKDVVEYSLSRNLSPALVSEYKTKLIDKRILQRKLHELFLLAEKG